MKRMRIYWLLVLSSLLLVFILANCSDPLVDMTYQSRSALQYPLEVDPPGIGDKDSPMTVNLIAGKQANIGTVDLWTEGEFLLVQFNSSWLLKETHLDIVSHPADFPQTKKGNPKPGQFLYKGDHSPGVNTCTYSIPQDLFEEGDVLYFAAHAEVELWEDSALIQCESAWAEGMDFPGANWAMYFAGQLSSGIDITGYWDVYLYTEYFGALGPMLSYFEQNGSDLCGAFGMTGTINGKNVYMEALDVDFGMGEPIDLFLNGTIEGNEIIGILTGGLGTGTFRFVRPSTMVFGHLDFSGTFFGEFISFESDYAVGYDEEYFESHKFRSSFQDPIVGDIGIDLIFPDLSQGAKTIVYDERGNPDQIQAMLFLNGGEFWAESGTVDVEFITKDHIILNSFHIDFPGIGYLSGTADLVTFTHIGTLSITGGDFSGFPLVIDDYTNIYSDYEFHSTTAITIQYFDQQMETMLFLGVSGMLESGKKYDTPYDFGMSFRYSNGSVVDEMFLDAAGSMTVHGFENSILNATIEIGSPYNFTGHIIDMHLNETGDDPF